MVFPIILYHKKLKLNLLEVTKFKESTYLYDFKYLLCPMCDSVDK